MKKNFALILLVLSILPGCGRKADFVQSMRDDLDAAVKAFPDSTVRLLEVQTALTNPVSEAGSHPRLSGSSTIIQVGSRILEISRFYRRGRESTRSAGFVNWYRGSGYPVDPNSVRVSFRDATRILEAAAVFHDKPYMELRGPDLDSGSPKYFFEREEGQVTVDAFTRAIDSVWRPAHLPMNGDSRLHSVIDSVLFSVITDEGDSLAATKGAVAAFASMASVRTNELKASVGIRYDNSQKRFINDYQLASTVDFTSLTMGAAFDLMEAVDKGYSLSSRIPTNHGFLDWEKEDDGGHIRNFESENATDSISFEQGYLLSSNYVTKYLRRKILGIKDDPPELTQLEWLSLYNSIPSARIRKYSRETCDSIAGLLRRNVQEGTGVLYRKSRVPVAGKPSSGIAGESDTGELVYHTSFAGFFPADDPEYTMVVTILVKESPYAPTWRATDVLKIFNGILNELEI